jgi:hypothetical protein
MTTTTIPTTVGRLADLDTSHAAALTRLGRNDATGRLAAVLAEDIAFLLRRAGVLRRGEPTALAALAERDLLHAERLAELAAAGAGERDSALLEAEVAFLRRRAAVLRRDIQEAS